MRTLLLAALLLASPALAQEPPPEPPAPPPPRTETVRLETPAGPILLAIEVERAPKTAANFLRYVREKRLDGTSFYRALKLTPDGSYGLIQFGLKGDPKRALPPIAHEPTSSTGLTHGPGALSMARAAPGTAQADMFIIIGGLPSLDANPAERNEGYAVFGRVVEGMETVTAILNAPTDPNAGEGAMKGQMIAKPIPLTSARIQAPR
jgi:peptidyl-prolyl cis-trans isomerase A (cyclophilin A)